jgi:hypothetical protein
MTITMTTSPKKRTSRQPRKLKICAWTHPGLIKWKTTSKKLEDDLKKNKNGRQPQIKMEDDLQKNVRRPPKIMENNLFFF